MAHLDDLKAQIATINDKVKASFAELSAKVAEVDQKVEAVFDKVNTLPGISDEAKAQLDAVLQPLSADVDKLGELLPAVDAVATDD